MELYLTLLDVTTMKQFKKNFKTIDEMEKFKNKLKYSKKLMIIRDSRESYIIGFGGFTKL